MVTIDSTSYLPGPFLGVNLLSREGNSQAGDRMWGRGNKEITRRLTFIKTTYDISLDSQISLLPLGFSLLGIEGDGVKGDFFVGFGGFGGRKGQPPTGEDSMGRRVHP